METYFFWQEEVVVFTPAILNKLGSTSEKKTTGNSNQLKTNCYKNRVMP